MADFQTWEQSTLAKFAEDSQAEIVRLNNQDCARLQTISELLCVIEQLCDEFCKYPVRIDAYVRGKEAIK
jgi:hypothetical protein